jgi:multidrug resistance efflux pump
MRRIINNLRQQPEEVRRQVLYIVTVVMGLVLVLLWIYSLGARVSNTDTAKVQEDLQPLTDLKSSVVDGYNDISGVNNQDNQ